jgi:beta-lactam-binding protein with PASTA domain
VPNVLGMRLAQARRRIVRAHCRVGRIRRVTSSRRDRNRVLEQRPRPGRRLPPRSRVNLTVGRGPR